MVESIEYPNDFEEISTFTDIDGLKGGNKSVCSLVTCLPSQCGGTEGRDDSECKSREIVDKEDPIAIDVDRSKLDNETLSSLWAGVLDDNAVYTKLKSSVSETRCGPEDLKDDDVKREEVVWTKFLDDSALYRKWKSSVLEGRHRPEDLNDDDGKTEEVKWTQFLDDSALYKKWKSSVPEARSGPEDPNDDDVLREEAMRTAALDGSALNTKWERSVPETRCGPEDLNDNDVIKEKVVGKEDSVAFDTDAPKEANNKVSLLADNLTLCTTVKCNVPRIHFEIRCEVEETKDEDIIIVSDEIIDPFQDEDLSYEDIAIEDNTIEDETIKKDTIEDEAIEDEAIEIDWESSKKNSSPPKAPHLLILDRLSKERQNKLEKQKELERKKMRKIEKQRKKELDKQRYTRQSMQLQSRLEKIYNREQKIRSMDMILCGFTNIDTRKKTKANEAGPSDISTTVSGKTGKTGMEVLRMDV